MKKITRLLATLALLFGIVGGVSSAFALKLITKTPVLLTGGVDGCNPTPDYYFIQMQGWQSFVAYENAEGVAFDEESTIVFNLKESVNNSAVRITLYFDDDTNQQCWWLLGVTPLNYGHAFDNSEFNIKAGLGNDRFEANKSKKITKVTIDNFNPQDGDVSALVTYKVVGGTICGQPLTIKNANTKTFGYYGAVFSPTAAQKNIFKFKPFEVGDYQKIIIEFGAETPSGWAIVTGSGYPPDLPTGITKHEIALNGTNLSEFSIFNWNANPAPINVSGVYLYKEEEEYATIAFDEFGSATVDKKYLTASDGLTYDAETGILTSDGTAGTMILEFAEPVDLKYLKTFEVKRSGGNDGIISRLKFYDEDGGVINTWNNSKLANSGLDNNATNAFINKPVKKLVWESDENTENNEKSFTISGVNFQLKTISCSKAGETILNTLPWIKIDDSSTPTPTWNMNVSTDTYYGNTSSDATHYVDLTDYEELRIYRDNNDGFRAFFINAAGTATNTITGANATWNTKEKYWSIDLSTIEKWENKVALKSIKSASYGVYNIVKNIVVYKTPAANAPQYILAGSGMQLAETVAALADANATCIDATGVTGITTNSEAGQTLLESANPNCLFLGKVGIGYMSNTQNVIDGDACDNLVLTDAKPYKAPVAFTATAAKFVKTVSAAQYATMVIPFDASIPEGVQAFNLKSIDNETIGKSDPLASITANSPVMIKNEGTFDFTASNVAIAATDEGELDNYFLHGGYSTMNVAADDGNYVLQNNDNGVNFYLVTGTPASLKPFRAYLKAPSSARVLYIGLDDTTGLNNVKGKMEDLNGEVYNLQGQRFSQPTKGLYIVNGKKVIIK